MFNNFCHPSLSKYIIPSLSLMMLCVSCSPSEQEALPLNELAPITPDFREVTLPVNLAPLRFALADSCRLDDVLAVFESGNEHIVVSQGRKSIAPSIDQWQVLKQASDIISVRIQGKREGQWVEFEPFHCYISHDSISRYLAYRLIEPGYEIWQDMGIYQRDLETYEQTTLITNRQTQNGCINCHSFCSGKTDNMLMHLRKEFAGTYILSEGRVERLDTKTPETISPLVYPYWHPSGRYVAFSTNSTKQAAHSTDRNRVEVFDLESDVVVYDVERHEVFSCEQLKSDAAFETFPTFSPDGKTLYFCSADTVGMPNAYQDVRYSLCAIGFDADSATFAAEVDTLYNARIEGRSVSFPRVSPDGRYLMFTLSAYGNFSIWHKDADIFMLLLADGTLFDTSVVNSDDVESYHSWSSNSRWAVISSRRDDGLYTRPYLVHVSADGTLSKPTPIPQEDAWHDMRLMKSYNIPELVDEPFAQHSTLFERALQQSATSISFRNHKK